MTNGIDTAYKVYANDPTIANRDAVVKSAHRLCWHWANRRYRLNDTSAMSADDLFQEAQIGVFLALQKYNGSKPFTYYATEWIRGVTMRYLQKHKGPGVYRLSRGRTLALAKYGRTRAAVEKDHPEFSNNDVLQEIADRLGIKLHHVVTVWAGGYIELDQVLPGCDDGSATRKDMLVCGTSAADDKVHAVRMLNRIRTAAETINTTPSDAPNVDRLMLAENILDGQPRSVRDLAKLMGVSFSSIHRVSRKVLEHMATYVRSMSAGPKQEVASALVQGIKASHPQVDAEELRKELVTSVLNIPLSNRNAHSAKETMLNNLIEGMPRTPTDVARQFGLTRQRGDQMLRALRAQLAEAVGS